MTSRGASSPDSEQTPSDAVTVRRVRRLMCLFTGLLVASTWPLWIPGPEFPDIPWLEWFCRAGETWIDWILLAILSLWLVVEFVGLEPYRFRSWVIRWLLASPLLFVLIVDQHRLQPWVWQMLLMATLISLPDDRTALRCLRWLTVSIYGHSAISKVDMAFLESHGQWLLEGLASSVGLSTALWSDTMRRVLASMFPVGELVTAAALLWPRTRRIGLMLAILMHGMLMLALGPLGHAQKLAVLLWNVFFIGLDVLLFGRTSSATNVDQVSVPTQPSAKKRGLLVPTRAENRAAIALTVLFAVLPCLSWWGDWDHWPSWAVYSSRPAIVQMYVRQENVRDLPASLRPFVGAPQPLSDLCPVNLDAWSFETLWCPMYPQERFRLAVAATLGIGNNLEDMRVVIHSSPDRWTGKREQTVLDGNGTVILRAMDSSHYSLNIQPRHRWWVVPSEGEN